jgi:hypothetical protein
MAARFSNLLWRFDLFLGGSIWIALLALAYSAGPIEEAVFWASLIAALPVGFGWICRCILTSRPLRHSQCMLAGRGLVMVYAE